jgi:flavodoxin
MRALIVYFSRFGNTRRIAEAIADGMKHAGDTRVIGIDQFAVSDLERVDLVVMGSPTHGFTVPQEIRSILEAQPPGILAGKSVAAFDTTVKPWPLRLMRASPKLLRQLQKLGGNPIAGPRTFFVKTSKTQQSGDVDLLLEGEIEQARQWAGEILDKSKALVKA